MYAHAVHQNAFNIPLAFLARNIPGTFFLCVCCVSACRHASCSIICMHRAQAWHWRTCAKGQTFFFCIRVSARLLSIPAVSFGRATAAEIIQLNLHAHIARVCVCMHYTHHCAQTVRCRYVCVCVYVIRPPRVENVIIVMLHK